MKEEKICLNGNCKLYFYDTNRYLAKTPDDLKGIEVVQLDAIFPSNVETVLSENGYLPENITFGLNIFETRKYEQYDFWYEIEFYLDESIKDKQFALQFDGVDTIAEYFLNGAKIGESKNMFITHTFSLKKELKVGKNILFIKLFSDVKYLETKEYPDYCTAFNLNYESLWIRKPPHVFSWDIMPRCLSRGIWRDAYLVIKNEIEIEDIYFATIDVSNEKNNARIYFKYDLKIPSKYYEKVNIKVTGICGSSKFETIRPLYFKSGCMILEIKKDLKLWNVRGYGEQNLYDIVVSIVEGETTLTYKKLKFGIREVKVINKSQQKTEDFLIEVNKLPIMVKGINWSGLDFLHSKDKEKLHNYLNWAFDLNINAIRCWGGNIYEDTEFYNFCDEHGILVWQDFAMACAQYPMEQEFVDELTAEVKIVCKKLRNHPSLIIYCGDNECDVFMCNKMINPEKNILTRKILPKIIFSVDPYRYFLKSSPYISPSHFEKYYIMDCPELHLWGWREYYKNYFYTNLETSFISEIGYPSTVCQKSLKKFISSQKLWSMENNEEWYCHSTVSERNLINGEYSFRLPLLNKHIEMMFGFTPQYLSEFTLASQIVQAEADKFFIEFSRQHKWNRTGIMIWNLNDGWPQFSDALIDFYGEKKLSYYFVKNSFKSVQIIIEEPRDWHANVTILNDGIEDLQALYQVVEVDTDRVVLSGNVELKANCNNIVGNLEIVPSIKKLYLLKCVVNDETIYNHYLTGSIPFDFEYYKSNFKKIANLVYGIDLEKVVE